MRISSYVSAAFSPLFCLFVSLDVFYYVCFSQLRMEFGKINVFVYDREGGTCCHPSQIIGEIPLDILQEKTVFVFSSMDGVLSHCRPAYLDKSTYCLLYSFSPQSFS